MTAADKQRLSQVRAATLGNRSETSLGNTLYPVYVAVIAAGAYGVPAAQQMFGTLEGKWLAAHAWTPMGAIVTFTVAGLLLAVVRLVGRVHGPVVPPLPYLELVVASPMPRKVTLARQWRLSLAGSIIGGLLVGLVAGAGLAIAEVASPVVLVPATLGGALFGLLVAELWLQGQVHSSPLGLRPGFSIPRRRRNALALLDITGLRVHAASNATMGGAVLAGDLRTVRLDAARPTTHARQVRLGASGPRVVIARRDLLGLRREPWSALYGLGFAAAGSAGLMLSLQSPRAPIVAPLVSLIIAYLGFGAWCEGLRLHADNSGTSRLLGIPYRDTALAHLAVPVSAWALTVCVVSSGLSLAGLVRPTAAAWALGAGALLAGAHLMAAFRGLPPVGVFGPHAGVPAMILWYSKPLLATLVVGTTTVAWAARTATPWVPFSWLLVLTAGVIAWGLSLVDKRDRRS
ncbi:MAG: hypothetical protein ABIP19_02625 [Dermatophilaceae bacterium]